MTNTCVVCGSNSAAKNPGVSFHRFPSDVSRRREWLSVYDITEDQYKPYWRICSRHFPGGDVRFAPVLQRGKCVASHATQPTRRAPARQARNDPIARHSCGPPAKQTGTGSTLPAPAPPALISTVAEPLEQAHSLVREPSLREPAPLEDKDVAIALAREATTSDPSACSLGVIVHTALLDQVKALDAENQMLKQQVCIPQASCAVCVSLYIYHNTYNPDYLL